MKQKQGIRRAGARWREEAPPYVVDCFDHGDQYADRYTVVVLPVYEGEVLYLTTSESGLVSEWATMKTYDMANYRYRSAYRRVRWLDLPERVRDMVTADMESNES